MSMLIKKLQLIAKTGNMKRLRYTFIISLLIISFSGNSQEKDSLVFINTFEYDLNHGISQFHRTCTNQKTFNLEGQLLREIDYTPTDSNRAGLESISYFFYNTNGELLSTEVYDYQSNLIALEINEYDKKTGNLLHFVTGDVQNDKLIVDYSIKYKYKKGKLINASYYNKQNKKSAIVTIIEETPETAKTLRKYTKHSICSSELISEETISRIESGNVIEEIIILNKIDFTSDTNRIVYTYEKKTGFNVEKNYYKNSQLVKKKRFQYYNNGKVKSLTVLDPEDKRIAFTTFDLKETYRIFGGLDSVAHKFGK